MNGVVAQVPWRHMTTPSGYTLSVAMSWCGNVWTSDSRGYRYSERHSRSAKCWPPIPHILMALADEAAQR